MTEIMIVLASGAGTFLLRLLPIWQRRRHGRPTSAKGRLRGLLEGIGPAAITALLVVSLWPLASSVEPTGHAPAATAGLVTVWAIKRRMGGIAAPTLAGALAYGLLVHFLGPGALP